VTLFLSSLSGMGGQHWPRAVPQGGGIEILAVASEFLLVQERPRNDGIREDLQQEYRAILSIL
jgi:hypothetical protein